MFKVRILNPTRGSNVHTFELFNRPRFQNLLQDVGIRIVKRNEDFLFVGTADFIDKTMTLEESISYGIQNVKKLGDSVFLFDGSDSTALLGAYEVLEATTAAYLLKPALLPLNEYSKPTAFNKWFFGMEGEFLKGYNIQADLADRILLTGWNLGNYWQYQIPSLFVPKSVDVSGVFRAAPYPSVTNYEHQVPNRSYYEAHRCQCKTAIEKLSPKWRVTSGCRDPIVTNDLIRRSYLSVSPLGWGEICYRDFEIGLSGAVLLKPAMSRIRTIPDIFVAEETYLPVNLDFSDLNVQVERIFNSHVTEVERISETFRDRFLKIYDYHLLAMYWVSLLQRAVARI